MRTILQVAALVVVGLGLSLSIVGCYQSATKATDKMENGNASSAKMEGGKMDTGKMEGGKMDTGKMDHK